MKKVFFLFYDMGVGHRSTANSLQEVIEKRKLPWKTKFIEVFKEVFNINLPQYVYNNFILQKQWTKFINDPVLVPLFKQQIRFCNSAWRDLLRTYWRQYKPDMVISLLPHINRIICQSLRAELPEIPFLTIMTDFADYPPNFWIEPQDQFLICPSEQAVKQARSFGYPEQKIFRTSGIIIHSRFYEPINVDRQIERQRLGLEPNLTTGLIMFGGYGSKEMIKIAERLEESSLKFQIIFICGRNEKLARDLRNSQSRLPNFVETFTSQIPYYMHLSDFFIGKPGNVCISEAIARNLPVITECNNLTLFQERAITQWVTDNKFGIVVDNFCNINGAVAELIQPENFACYQANVKSYDNQAVFEVVDILERFLEKT